MNVEKTRGSKAKISISPSRALEAEAARQVENGMWDSKTDFFEAGAWLLVELQTLGVDLLEGDTADENQMVPSEAQRLIQSEARLTLNIDSPVEQPKSSHPQDDDDNADGE